MLKNRHRSDSLCEPSTLRNEPVLLKLKHPLKRHNSELSGLPNQMDQLSLVSAKQPGNVNRRHPTIADDIKRRECLYKAIASTANSDHEQLKYKSHDLLSNHERLRQNEVGWTGPGWTRTERRGTTFTSQYLSTSLGQGVPKTASKQCATRRRSSINTDIISYKHMKRGSISKRALVKHESLDSLDETCLEGNHPRIQRSRQLKRQRTFPQLVRKVSLLKMICGSPTGDKNGHKKRLTPAQIEKLKRKAALDRFRRAGRMIQIMLRAVNDIKSNYALRKKKQADIALAESIVHVGRDVGLPGQPDESSSWKQSGLMFDPGDFKPRAKGQLSHETKKLLSKSPENRTSEDIRTIKLCLQSAMDAFAEFPKRMQESIAKVAWYEKFEPNRVMIRQGHRSAIYYLILSGTAAVNVSSTDFSITGDAGMKHVAFLKKGNSFGEIALMHHAIRAATVVCKETLELLAMDREDFMNIFMHRSKGGQPEFIDFLQTIPELHDWPLHFLPHDKPTVCLFTFFRKGVVICKDNNASDWIYVIKSGTCRVLKKLAAPTDLFEARSALMGVFDLTEVSGGTPKSPWESGHQRNTTHSVPKPKQERLTVQMAGSSIIKLPKITVNSQLKRERPTLTRMESELLMDLPHGPIAPKVIGQAGDEKTVYLQIQRLTDNAIFGLQSVLEQISDDSCGSTSVTLVSDGAECVLISKKFFVQHLTVKHRIHLETMIRPYPSEANLLNKLQLQTTWEQYKCRTMQRAIHKHSKVTDTQT